MNEALDELAQILSEIEAYHGTIQSLGDYRAVKALHEQARQCLAKIREEVAKLQQDYDDSQVDLYKTQGEVNDLLEDLRKLQEGHDDLPGITFY
jgi:uncharacterized protein (DUF3084 family)